MKVLIACEESQVGCKAFRAAGHEAFSCDIKPCSGGHPEWHIQDDVLKYINLGWDLIIAHPPCTYLSSAGSNRLFVNGAININRFNLGKEAAEFFMEIYNADCEHICIENPTPIKLFGLPPYDQLIHPYQFGDPWYKRTCLWLKNLPILWSTDYVVPLGHWIYAKSSYKSDELRGFSSQENRSKSFNGILSAMVSQWGELK